MNAITYKIPGNSAYVISEDLNILDIETSTALKVKDDRISISLYGRIVDVNIDWLFLYSRYGLKLESGYEQYVNNIVFKPYNLKSQRNLSG